MEFDDSYNRAVLFVVRIVIVSFCSLQYRNSNNYVWKRQGVISVLEETQAQTLTIINSIKNNVQNPMANKY